MTGKTWVRAAILAGAAAVAVPFVVHAAGPGSGWNGAGHGAGMQGERPGFEMLDADGDGNITVAEMKAFGRAKFDEIDTNGDGVVTADEMAEHAAARAGERAAMRFARMIEWRDADGDGGLSPAEMAGDRGEKMFTRLDENDDGMISAEEFAAAAERGGRNGMGRRDGHGGFGERGGHGDHGDHGGRGDHAGQGGMGGN